MKLRSFRVTNFRSIVDTGWVNFSTDGITILVGQNESGKTSILEALSKTFNNQDEITSDDLRIGADLPAVKIQVELDEGELDEELKEFVSAEIDVFKRACKEHAGKITVRFGWRKNDETTEGFVATVGLEEGSFTSTFDLLMKTHSEKKAQEAFVISTIQSLASNLVAAGEGGVRNESATKDSSHTKPVSISHFDIALAIYNIAPTATLFDSISGLLPKTVDIDEKNQLVGDGAIAAQNFLKIADLQLDTLIKSDLRSRTHLINRANQQISRDFATFWSQTIGRKDQLQLQCEMEVYGTDTPEKVGKSYLVFWISDGLTRLYPHQRSQGVRWFVSFYLQLKASEKLKSKRLFLLDEPGANLHSKAQGDVLKLINQLSKDIPIVYSTHSPHMIEYSRLYRIHAVQRDGDAVDSPTVVVDAHRLGTASTDTLSPVLTAMGVDLSSQQVIKKKNNVLLEEMSGFYYLSAFWQLAKVEQEAHFIAATGVNKIQNLANLFRGWGLDFIVAMDDDSQARTAFNAMKREMYGDSDAEAEANMVKFKGCKGIEDVFSQQDFKTFVLKDQEIVITDQNSEFMKHGARSKPLAGYMFLLDVKAGLVNFGNFEEETRTRINEITSSIVKRLVDKNHIVEVKAGGR